MHHLVGTIRILEESAVSSRMSDHGSLAASHAMLMPPLGVEVQAFCPDLPRKHKAKPYLLVSDLIPISAILETQ
jgi:hypothetical protein